eukprot:6131033-Prymnesium_polylepis.1
MLFVCGLPPMYQALCGPRDSKLLRDGSVLELMGYTADMVAKMARLGGAPQHARGGGGFTGVGVDQAMGWRVRPCECDAVITCWREVCVGVEGLSSFPESYRGGEKGPQGSGTKT